VDNQPARINHCRLFYDISQGDIHENSVASSYHPVEFSRRNQINGANAKDRRHQTVPRIGGGAALNMAQDSDANL